ncbi:MAG: S41 family peptidase [Alphaproteobacteria bacterium]|nr:S41 family peptidase [Alphaproteobacteria bacterium]
MRGACACVIVATAWVAWPAAAQTANTETYRQLELFGDVFERVRAEYVEKVDDAQLIEAAINGMLAALDPHSSYLNAKNFTEMQVQTRGSFGGLGIEVTMENGLVKVISPIDDTPAFRAGVMAGDVITHLDAEPVLGMTLTEAVERMRGPVNSTIELTVRRAATTDPLKIAITRAVIKLRSVRHRLESNAGYIRINSFSEQTSGDVESAVAAIERQLGNDLEGFVLDLRNNPGGLLDQAVQVSDLFLDRGEIVSTRGRRPETVTRYNAKKGDVADGRPIIVLINGGSASAAEIVAGALQDHKRALVLGTTSFGKGSVQTVTPLGENGALRLTTSRYYTPSGRSIQATGIEPDIAVAQARVEAVEAAEAERREAALRNHLEGGPEGAEAAPDAGEAPVAQPAAPEEPTEESPLASGAADDYQLRRALDLLHGLSLFAAHAVE